VFRSRTGPSFGSSKDDHGEPRFVDGLARASGLLNLSDLSVSPIHRSSHVLVTLAIGGVSSSGRNLSITFVFDESNLITVTGVEEGEFSVVHSTGDSAFRDLETVDVKDRDDSTRFFGVEVLVRMPGGSGRTSLGFSVSDNDDADLIRSIHY